MPHSRLLTLALIFMLTSLNAQTEEDLFANWYSNLDEGLYAARNENKDVLLIFNGSDWCSSCKEFTQKVLSNEKFNNYANDNFIVIHLDYKQDTTIKHSKEELLHLKNAFERFNPEGYFPYVVITDQFSRIIDRFGYNGNNEREYLKRIQRKK